MCKDAETADEMGMKKRDPMPFGDEVAIGDEDQPP